MLKWKQNFRDCKLEKKAEVVMHRKRLICCLETMVKQIFATGTDQARSKFGAMCQVFHKRFETFAPPAQMPGREEETAVGVTDDRRDQSRCTGEQFGA